MRNASGRALARARGGTASELRNGVLAVDYLGA
jgi:hypothetical protein